MNFFKKINLFNISFLSIISIIPICSSIFGDGTQARIFSNPAIAFMKCELRKYVQK